MHNHYGMPTSTGSFFLNGGLYISNQSVIIPRGLISFVSQSFSGRFYLFEAMDMVLFMAETDSHTIETLISLPKS